MLLSDLDFDLPEELIAYEPATQHGQDRLLLLNKDSGMYQDRTFRDITQLLPKNALLVFNNSKVQKARLQVISESGNQLEFLLVRPLGHDEWLCMVQKSKRQHVGKSYTLPAGLQAKITATEQDGLKRVLIPGLTQEYLDQYGQMPLPPYIKRSANSLDEQRYQTIYAKEIGSCAAPTAGLHFTTQVLEDLKQAGHTLEFITLHVGLGTFMPIRTQHIEDHTMHSECFEISEQAAHKINDALKTGQPIIAIGTTSCRALESAFDTNSHQIRQGLSETSIFIYPGYQFKATTGLFTNFHTPGSTLLAMVSALAGYENIKKAYAHAINEKYRFFSYGDCMLII